MSSAQIQPPLDIYSMPLLDISGGVDPGNMQWRTNQALYQALCDRSTQMSKFMKTLCLKKMSTHLTFNGTKYRVLIDNTPTTA